MAKDIQLVANDLKVYYNGFEVAIGKGNIDEAVEYLRKIKVELDDNLQYLLAKKEASK